MVLVCLRMCESVCVVLVCKVFVCTRLGVSGCCVSVCKAVCERVWC